jgi:hypothetical protein
MDNRYEYTEEETAAIRTTTSGWYKQDPGGQLLFGRFYVLNADYELYRHLKDTYTYPIDGWSWYESEEEARTALGIVEPPTPEEQVNTLLSELDEEQIQALKAALGNQ